MRKTLEDIAAVLMKAGTHGHMCIHFSNDVSLVQAVEK
jgi:hypothetical protein